MDILFATTNKRKIEDVLEIIKENNLDIHIITLDDINYQEEIDETGVTLAENSLIKAREVLRYCRDNHFGYSILSDDAGIFIDALDGEPGIHTTRYADLELKKDPTLPKYQCVIKALDKLKNVSNRSATYRCVVTFMYPDGNYFQVDGESKGWITDQIIEPIKKPYFYSVFCLENEVRTFNQMSPDELKDTYRYQAMRKVLTGFSNQKNQEGL